MDALWEKYLVRLMENTRAGVKVPLMVVLTAPQLVLQLARVKERQWLWVQEYLAVQWEWR
jgi:hypothetical protein